MFVRLVGAVGVSRAVTLLGRHGAHTLFHTPQFGDLDESKECFVDSG